MSRYIDISGENKFYDSFVEHLEKDYANTDTITSALQVTGALQVTDAIQEQKKARGIVPETAKSVPASPTRISPTRVSATRKPSRNGKFFGSMEK